MSIWSPHRRTVSVVGVTDDRRDRDAVLVRHIGHRADHLAVEAGCVESPLTGDDEVDIEVVIEVQFVGHEFESGNQPSAERRECATQPTCGPAASDGRDVEGEVAREHLDQALEPT